MVLAFPTITWYGWPLQLIIDRAMYSGETHFKTGKALLRKRESYANCVHQYIRMSTR